MKTRVYERFDFSAAIQQATSWLNRGANELEDGRNLRFNDDIGGIVRRNGYKKASLTKFSSTDKAPSGFHTAQFTTGAKKLVAVNANDNSATLVRVQEDDGTYTTIINDLPPDSDVYFKDFRDEVYVSGFTKSDGVPFQPRNIDKDLNVSLTRNLLFAPWPKYFEVYRGILYAVNVKIDTERFPDRFYKSSAPTGAITFVRGQQSNPYVSATLINQVPAMTSNTAPSGTASASTVNSTNAAWQAFDRDSISSNTRWLANATTGWVRYDFGAGNGKVVNYYALTGMNDTSLTRNPKTWILQGSNDGSTWTDLHTVTNAAAFTQNETRTFYVNNTNSYQYYRLNISANQGASDYTGVKELALYASLESTPVMELNVDVARYLKPGMLVEIYKSGTSQLLATVTIDSVDKVRNSIRFIPEQQQITSVNATTDEITLPSTADLPTGAQIRFSGTGTLPAPLAVDTTYYVINTSSTTIKVATTYENALIASAINLTTAGTGAQFAIEGYSFNNNDEIWLSGRYGELTSFWNTDYPTSDRADWSAVQPGSDSSNEITGVKESTNRLFVFTLNSGSRFDGTNTITFSKTIGCASQRSIQNIDDDWLIWLTARGRVYARNEASGQQEYISRGLWNRFFKYVTLDQLKASVAGITDGEYTVYIGEFKGKPHRAIYDFGSNTWTIDELNHPTLMYANDSSTGEIKPYFLSDNGYMYEDDTGDDDDGKAIRFYADLGRVNYGTESEKYISGNYVYSENAKGVKINVSIDGGDPQLVGEIIRDCGRINYNVGADKERFRGSVMRIILTSAVMGVAPRIFAVHDYFNVAEEMTGHGKQQ